MQLIPAVLGLNMVSGRFAFVAQQWQVRAQMLAPGLASFQQAGYAVDFQVPTVFEGGHSEGSGDAAVELQG
jgi:hypothetical protein